MSRANVKLYGWIAYGVFILGYLAVISGIVKLDSLLLALGIFCMVAAVGMRKELEAIRAKNSPPQAKGE